jgi:putative ABC transport system permease protein
MNEPTIFFDLSVIPTVSAVVMILIILLSRFFNTDFGLSIRAVGINQRVSTAYGINVKMMKIAALAISNATVALAGSLFTQSQGFSDISMGAGTVIVGLAAVIIGEAVVHPYKIIVSLITCVAGSIVYRLAIAFALNADDIGLEASDLNLISAVLVACVMRFSKRRNDRA